MGSLIAELKEEIIDRILLMKKRIHDGNDPEKEYAAAIAEISLRFSEVDELYCSAMNSMW